MEKHIDIHKPEQLLSVKLEETKQQIHILRTKLNNRPDYTRGVADPRMTSWELDQLLLRRLKQRMESIKHAKRSLQAGTYGSCEFCGNPINPERLEILPETQYCIECAQKR